MYIFQSDMWTIFVILQIQRRETLDYISDMSIIKKWKFCFEILDVTYFSKNQKIFYECCLSFRFICEFEAKIIIISVADE